MDYWLPLGNWIARDEQSELLGHIAMESISLCVAMKN
jgi:hypothetical protein